MGREILTEIEVAATPARVWQVLTDLDAYPQWNPFITRAHGELRVGARLEVLIQIPGESGRVFRPEVLKVERERELRWLGRFAVPGLFNGEHFFKIEPRETGRTRFLHGERFTGLLVPFLGRMLDKTERGFGSMNDALKTRAEAVGQ